MGNAHAHNSDVTRASCMASQITGGSAFNSRFSSGYQKIENAKTQNYWPFVRESIPGSPHKGPVMQKAIPCHTVSCRALRELRCPPDITLTDTITTALHHDDVIMGAMASQITGLTIVSSTVYSGADQRKHQSSASLVFVRVNSPGTGEFPAQMASDAENVSFWWRHHGAQCLPTYSRLMSNKGYNFLTIYSTCRYHPAKTMKNRGKIAEYLVFITPLFWTVLD